jgi:hypothetical protein
MAESADGNTALDGLDLDEAIQVHAVDNQDKQEEAPKPKADDSPAKPVDTVSRKEFEAIQARNRELEEENRFWAGKARGTTEPKPEPKAEPDELEQLLAEVADDSTAAELLDELGEKGVGALSKRGVITKGQLKAILAAQEERLSKRIESTAAAKVDAARSELNAEAKLLRDFPEMGEDGSEFSKAAAVEFAQIVKDDPALNNYTGLRLAAKIVKARGTTAPGGGAETALSRAQRIAAQGPTRGKRAAEPGFDSEGEFGSDDRHLLQFSSRYGVTEKQIREAKRMELQ